MGTLRLSECPAGYENVFSSGKACLPMTPDPADEDAMRNGRAEAPNQEDAGFRHLGRCDAFAPFMRFFIWAMRNAAEAESRADTLGSCRPAETSDEPRRP
jgi:hypothetical protein